MASDRRHVMFAMALEGNLSKQHHLVVAGGFFEGLLEEFLRLLVVSRKIAFVRARDPKGRLGQSFTGRVFSDPGQDCSNSLLDVLLRDSPRLTPGDLCDLVHQQTSESSETLGRVAWITECWNS
jgi:hypothetical protein